jgi:hypothetical protein
VARQSIENFGFDLALIMGQWDVARLHNALSVSLVVEEQRWGIHFHTPSLLLNAQPAIFNISERFLHKELPAFKLARLR